MAAMLHQYDAKGACGMSEDGAAKGDPVDFGARFTGSELFEQIFKEGMALVEETANYLDGAGREQSRRLGKTAALAYATESMRLTTRLMQIASWLLIRRAVAEGEMPAAEAHGQSGRVALKPPIARRERAFAETLPDTLRDLMARTDRIYERLYRLDRMLDPASGGDAGRQNAVVDQMDRLRSAFDGRGGGED